MGVGGSFKKVVKIYIRFFGNSLCLEDLWVLHLRRYIMRTFTNANLMGFTFAHILVNVNTVIYFWLPNPGHSIHWEGGGEDSPPPPGLSTGCILRTRLYHTFL